MERLTISLPRELRAKLQRIARDHGASEAAVIRAALEFGVPELERQLLAEATSGPRFDYSKSRRGPLELARPILEQHETEADPPPENVAEAEDHQTPAE